MITCSEVKLLMIGLAIGFALGFNINCPPIDFQIEFERSNGARIAPDGAIRPSKPVQTHSNQV